MSFTEEQQEIIKLIDSLLDSKHSGYGWGHFQGDVVPRVLAYYANRHLPNKLKIVGPNVYIEDVTTEFDLMVVDSDANPITFTSAYPGERVLSISEMGHFLNRTLWHNQVALTSSLRPWL